jgi:hypothetical protein
VINNNSLLWAYFGSDRPIEKRDTQNWNLYTNLLWTRIKTCYLLKWIQVRFIDLCRPHLYLSNYGSTIFLLDLGHFFSFVILYTVGRTPWTGDRPVARPLPTRRITQTQNKHTHRRPCLERDSNPRSQRSKTVQAPDRASTVTCCRPHTSENTSDRKRDKNKGNILYCV